MVEATIRAGEEYAPSFYVLLTVAGLIAAVGILTNSQILVVGAMVVGPEYSAIIAVALAFGHQDGRSLRAGLLALFWGFLGAVVVTGVFALAVRAADLTPAAYRVGLRPVSALIGTPNVFSVAVATLAGIVGVVSLTVDPPCPPGRMIRQIRRDRGTLSARWRSGPLDTDMPRSTGSSSGHPCEVYQRSGDVIWSITVVTASTRTSFCPGWTSTP